MAKPIEVEPFETAEIGFTFPGPFTFQEFQHAGDVRVLPLAQGQVHVCDVGVRSGLVSREVRLLLLVLRLPKCDGFGLSGPVGGVRCMHRSHRQPDRQKGQQLKGHHGAPLQPTSSLHPAARLRDELALGRVQLVSPGPQERRPFL